jgi:hypothetical protein
MVLYLFYLASLLFSAIIAFVNRKALESRQLSLFIPYLSLVFLQELSVFIFRQYDSKSSTALIYNIYRPVSTCFLAWVFYQIPVNFKARKPILWIQSLFLISTIITFLFFASIRSYNRFLSFLGGFVITLYGIFFLFNYFNLDDTIEEKKWRPVIWIATGLVIFYPVVNISLVLYKYINAIKATMFGSMLSNSIPMLMSIFMYSCFAYAFYLCKKKN